MRRQAQASTKLLQHAGPLAMLLFLAAKLLHRWTRARILLVYLREPTLLAALDPMMPAGFTPQVRRPDALGNLAPACAAALSVEFLTQASNNDDRCLAILDGDCVVSYQWLSEGLTWAYDDIWIRFGPRYLYGYNSFTAPSHRGRHLNHSGVVAAAQILAVPQGKGLAGYIAATNVSSILAHSRVSSKYSGVVLVWPHGPQGLRVLASSGCRAAGLELVRQPVATFPASSPAPHIDARAPHQS